MLPAAHILSTVIVIAVVSFTLGIDVSVTVLWIFVGIATTLLIDVDPAIYPLLKRENWHVMGKLLKDPFYIIRDSAGFVNEIHFPGLGIIRLGIHSVWALIIYVFVAVILSSLTLPVAISIATHLALDTWQVITVPESR